MKKFFYIAIVTIILSMVANSAKANYLYLHHTNEEHKDIVDTIYVDEDAIGTMGVYYTDHTKAVAHYMSEFPIPTRKGFIFLGYRFMNQIGQWEDVVVFDEAQNRYKVKGQYLNLDRPLDVDVKWGIDYDYEEPTTAIDEIDNNTSKPTEIYTLNGVKVKEITQSGIYIVNGKKTFVKK
jgi:hypothetical protein